MKYVLILLLVGLATSGCMEKLSRPPPPAFLKWTAPGKSVVDVQKKLIECGMPDPSGSSYAYRELDRNTQISISFCMMYAGFDNTYDYPPCRYDAERTLPACAPRAAIPAPSVNRRLNSPYCKAKTDYQYCKQNALNPPACDNYNYDNPVPECLP